AIRRWLDPTAALWSLALLALSLQPVLYLIHAAKVLPYPFDLDQGEGYDLNAGWRLAQGLPIYTDNESFPYYSSNYPPVYSLALAASIAVAGPNLLSGRLVSLAATVGLAGLVFVAARRPAAFGGVLAI